MYACFTPDDDLYYTQIVLYIAPARQAEKEKKEEENALFFIYATVHAVHAREH
jgi:hypothetical protein